MKNQTVKGVILFSIYLFSFCTLLSVARANPAVDHSIYAELLKKYVKDGKVNYAGFKKDGSGSLHSFCFSL